MAIRHIITAATMSGFVIFGTASNALTPRQVAVIDAIETRIDSAEQDLADLKAIIHNRSLPQEVRTEAYAKYKVIRARFSQLKAFKGRVRNYSDARLRLVIDFFDLPVSYS